MLRRSETFARARIAGSGALLFAVLAACGEQDGRGSDEVASAGAAESGGDLVPLSSVPVPRPAGGDILDRAAAVRLGKALFWDTQTGGDGTIACATCHHDAGADTRRLNVVNPGPNGRFEAVTSPGQLFSGTSIPAGIDDVIGSQGIVGSTLVSVSMDPENAADMCSADHSAPFLAWRRVTGRNTPSAVGAAYFRDLFWDGRASFEFNGANPFGTTGNSREMIGGLITNGGLSSQAVGPPNSSTEMACAGRAFNGPGSLGSKMLFRQALHFQHVDPTDSVLRGMSAYPAPGLVCGGMPCTYRAMIRQAFGPAIASDAERLFSRIWGQAVAAYEATLIPDQTPLDRYLAGDRTAMTDSQIRGLGVFTGKGGCNRCHAGAELSDATVSFAAKNGLINEDGGDQGFHNIGVRPTAEDLGRAGLGPNGVSWSRSGAPADRGAFKTPALRNVALTPPYFHDGRMATLSDVVDFYDRGGDFANPELAKRIEQLGLSATDKVRLVDFLTNGLTDCRTRMERAPFDHPELSLPNGDLRPARGAAGTGPCR